MARTTTAEGSASKEPPARKRSVPVRKTGLRTTTSIVIRPYVLAVYQRVAALRSALGHTEPTEAGIERAYSVSGLIRESLEARIPDLEAELTKAGIALPEQLPAEDEEPEGGG